ncbi:hypothetical protein D3C78_1623780 [compost metagenome]
MGRFLLTAVNGSDATAHHLGEIGAFIDAEPENGSHERRDNVDHALVDEARNIEARKDQRDVEPDEKLQQHRRAAKDPDIEPGGKAQDRVFRQTHDAEGEAQCHAEGKRAGGNQQRPAEAGDDHARR